MDIEPSIRRLSVRRRVGVVLGTAVAVVCLLLAACGGESSNGTNGSPGASHSSGSGWG